MHCLYSLSRQGFNFELKGGTSLSKGFGIIQRFSEDIDIRIDPACAPFPVYTGRNHMKSNHIESRRRFYDFLADTINIPGISEIVRDHAFDDERFRSGGIRLNYGGKYDKPAVLKEGILLEAGFDDTKPYMQQKISSWVYDKAASSNVTVVDNRALNVPCYHPGYTFVEKLQTVSKKFRQQQNSAKTPPNFLRHYYDIHQLLNHGVVQTFIGTTEYHKWKEKRFGSADNLVIARNEAFLLSDAKTREQYTQAYLATATLYFGEPVTFDAILEKIKAIIEKL